MPRRMSIVTTSPASDARSREIGLERAPPARLNVGRHAREAVARQVDEASILAEREEIQQLRASRCLADARELARAGRRR